MKNRHTDVSACVHCHKCQEHCLFLKKYQMDIGDEDKLKELAYHCFLCGKCTEVCPKGIDGREYILNLRRQQVAEADGRLREKGYGMLLWEKQNYRFRNYRNASSGSLLFPGCNFPSFYPKTTKKLVQLLSETAGIGVAYDCCGKPVAELGLEKQEEQIIRRMDQEMVSRGVTEVIMVCPNCYYFLKPRLSVKVVSIYEKLSELGLGKRIPGGGPVFLPCPDRESRKWLKQMEAFMERPCEPIEQVMCCGLGGCAGAKEPELARELAEKIGRKEPTYVYCASCGGNLTRNGCGDVRHVLAEILETGEQPDTGKSLLNRAKTKWL
ncbi:MAG: (Fe-S)-binding protein [Eubacteriales bacterium]|nr:(Fe-S)-binding protein [Eubacteriales bacterium]